MKKIIFFLSILFAYGVGNAQEIRHGKITPMTGNPGKHEYRKGVPVEIKKIDKPKPVEKKALPEVNSNNTKTNSEPLELQRLKNKFYEISALERSGNIQGKQQSLEILKRDYIAQAKAYGVYKLGEEERDIFIKYYKELEPLKYDQEYNK